MALFIIWRGMNMFKCFDDVIYADDDAIVIGVCYGNSVNRYAGKTYDIKTPRGVVFKSVLEKYLKKAPDVQ